VPAEVIATVMVLQALEGLSLSALAADGGTLDRLAGRRRLPAGALPGIEGNNLWWSLRVAAVNLRRLLVLGLTREDGTWVLA
jgi:hypothetical protein